MVSSLAPGLKAVVDSSLNFADAMYERIRPDIVHWATGEGSFVVVGLLDAVSGKCKEELSSQLKRSQKILKSHIGGNKGTKIVLEKVA
jgi:pumilio homology domain family member 6